MATRSAVHGKDEKPIFEAFLVAHPPFAANVKEVHQPDDQFPDIVATMTDGTEVDFELGEWLDGAQMGEAKRYERLQKAILDAIAPPGPNLSPHFRAVMLSPREDATRFDPADWAAFRSDQRAPPVGLFIENDYSQTHALQKPRSRLLRSLIMAVN